MTPTILSLYGLPVGEDMDGKVLTTRLRGQLRRSALFPSWDDVPGEDGRHPPHTRFDPLAASEALEQMVALGYIERPDEDRRRRSQTIHELRYNLGEAYQDAARHSEARGIFRELYRDDPDEQRYAVQLFVSCQALGMQGRNACHR